MSWNITVRRVDEVRNHPTADRLEICMIGGWPCIVPMGQYKKDDLIVYFPADSIIPEKWLEEWGLVGRLAGRDKNRVKPIRLRKKTSIGIICHAPEGACEGDDMQAFYGVERWEETIPECLRGTVRPKPRTFIKYGVDNIYNNPRNLEVGELISCSLKIHGVSAYYGLVDNDFIVCSRNLALEEDDTNLYWKMARKYNIEDLMLRIKSEYMGHLEESATLWIHGEIFGKGVQDLTYGLDEPEFRFFDIRVDNTWILGSEMEKYFGPDYENMHMELISSILTPPNVYYGPYQSLEHLKTLATGLDGINNVHIREGIVIKCINNQYDYRGNRRIFKCLNEDYLLRKNGTEHH